jgi:transposase InsO family protein
LWGYRIIIPAVFREQILQELHVGHLGIVKMKAIARSYVWWPGIDADIERLCAGCGACAAEAPAPPRAPVQPWQYPAEVWTRLHIDFLGPWQGKTFLILIDASSKWVEAFSMANTTGTAVVKILRETFARFGLPKQIVSDNGPPFTGREVDAYMRYYGITHTFTPAYHPASNGAAEAAVKLCKRALKKAFREHADVEEALQEYLMAYRNTPHSTTGQSPAMLLQRRGLRCRLDMLRPGRDLEQRVQAAQGRQVRAAGGTDRIFSVGDLVWFRDYGSGEKWLRGKVDSLIGSRIVVVVRENDLSIKFRRHVDQVRSRAPVSVLSWPGPMGHAQGPPPPPMPAAHPVVPRLRRRIRPVEHYGDPLLY